MPNWIAAVEAEATSAFGRAPDEFAALREPVLAFYERHRTELEDLAVGAVLQHGDFKASNLHWTTSGALLVLDWEFAFAGPPLMDLGQLVRWPVPRPFLDAFESGYKSKGGRLPQDWTERAAAFDLVNLVDLLARAKAWLHSCQRLAGTDPGNSSSRVTHGDHPAPLFVHRDISPAREVGVR